MTQVIEVFLLSLLSFPSFSQHAPSTTNPSATYYNTSRLPKPRVSILLPIQPKSSQNKNKIRLELQ